MIREKIRGIEQEYPISTSAHTHIDPHVLVNLAIHRLRKDNRFAKVGHDISPEMNTYMINGGRIYNDLDHLEISSPSYNDPIDALAFDRAGEIYAYIASNEASKALQCDVFAHKNNVANFFHANRLVTNTYATHGNICLLRKNCANWRRVERALVPWMICRILFTGSGDIVSYGKPRFVISPRAMFTLRISSLDTMHERGILNTRDEPHAAKGYWRFHDINYEALRCDFALITRDILQCMVMHAFERGLLDDAPIISDPVLAFKKMSCDYDECKWEIDLKNGKTSAPDVLRFYLERIEKMYEDEEMDRWERIGLRVFEELVADLENRRMEKYVDAIDWVTKLALLANYDVKGSGGMVSICNQYALLSKDTLFDSKDALQFAKRYFPLDVISDRIKYSVNGAPKTTRDYFRSIMLGKFSERVKEINWSKIRLDDTLIILDEPFMLTKEEFDDDMSMTDILKRVKKIYPNKVF